MPTLPTRTQQPAPVSAQVPLPPDFPAVPQSVVDRFPEAAEWQSRLKDFWNRASQAIQTSQQQAAIYANSRVVYTVDSFLIYTAEGQKMPMFALDDTGIRLGNVLVVDTPARSVYIGAGAYQDADTPFYIDTEGKFSLGANLTWDPATATLTVTGTIIATSGTIGGFDIGADYIRDTANSMGLASTVTGGDDVRFWAGDTFANRASAPFFVKESGDITANNATIVGTISGRSTATVASTIDSSGDVVTDLINVRIDTSAKTMLSDFTFGATDYAGALKSGTITWNTTTGAITGGSGVLVFRGGIIGAAAGVATFTINAATGSATFAGALSAPTGNIGGFTIGSDYIRDAADSMGLASTVTGGDDVRFWAGAAFASRGTAPFRVTESGSLVATSATISGTITSTSGTIGGFTISATDLTAGSGDNYIDITSDLPGKAGVGITLGAGATGHYVLGVTIYGVTSLVASGSTQQGGFQIDGFDVVSSTTDGVLILYKDGASGANRITLRAYDGSITTYGDITAGGKIRANTAFNHNGTDGITGTIVAATFASASVRGGIITAIT